MANYLKSLDIDQKKVVKFTKGLAIVIAAAGSGKTRVIERRTACLISHDVTPSAILLLTFTRKAAEEMIARAREFNVEASQVQGGTMHSFALQLLRQYSALAGLSPNFCVADTDKCTALISKIRDSMLGKANIELPSPLLVLKIISYSRNNSVTLERAMDALQINSDTELSNIKTLAKSYKGAKREKGLVDFDDLLSFAVKLLSQHPKIRIKLRRKYLHIMVDEFQDTNLIQAKFIKMLYQKPTTSNPRSLLLVGDPGQSIYSFRGARFANWRDFQNRSDAIPFELDTNYRSTVGIIKLANIVDDKTVIPRQSIKPKPGAPDNGMPILASHQSPAAEAKAICSIIQKTHKNGVSLGRQAILARAVSTFHSLEIELISRKIPYRLVGGTSLNKSAHIRDMMAIFEFVNNRGDTLAMERVLQLIPSIGLKTAALVAQKTSEAWPKSEWVNVLKKEISHKGPIGQLVVKCFRIATSNPLSIERRVRYLSKILRPLLEAQKQYSENLEERLADFDSLAEIAGESGSLRDFVASLSIDPIASGNAYPQTLMPGKIPLTLSTIHSAKGLEWDVVYLPSLLQNKFPSSHAKSPDALAEERRMFYVAITRAKKFLYLSRPASTHRLGRKHRFMDSHFLSIPGFKHAAQFDHLT